MIENIFKAFKNSTIYALGNIFNKLIGFILLPSYLGVFSTEDYGILGLMEVSSQILIAILGLSLPAALHRYYFDKDYLSKKNEMFSTALFSLFIVAIISFLIIRYYSVGLSGFLTNNPDRSYLINLVLISAAFEVLLLIPRTLLRLQEKASFYTFSIIIKTSIAFLFTILFVLKLNRNIEGIYEALILGQLFSLIILLSKTRNNFSWTFDSKILKLFVKFSSPLVLASVAGVLFNVMDRYLINSFGGLSETGVYSLGYKIGNTIRIFFVASLNLAISPIIFKLMNAENNKRIYSKLALYSLLGIMFFVLMISVFGFEIISVMIQNFAKDNRFLEAYKIIPIIAFTAIFIFLVNFAIYGLHLSNKTKYISGILLVVSLLNIFLNIYLIPLLGIYGAALAFLLSQIIYFLLTIYIAQKNYYIPYEFRKIFLVILGGATIIIVSLLINEFNLILRVFIKCGLLFSFPFILYFFNFYEEVEIERIKKNFYMWKNPLSWKSNFQKMKTNVNKTK